jgi:hypothetical protein
MANGSAFISIDPAPPLLSRCPTTSRNNRLRPGATNKMKGGSNLYFPPFIGVWSDAEIYLPAALLVVRLQYLTLLLDFLF